MNTDIMAIGAHPDDVELACGGSIAKFTQQGYKVILVDLTQGELGTRGTKEVRTKEGEEAARILGCQARVNLCIPDGNIEISQDNIKKLISTIRAYQPRLLLIPHFDERHPDHVHAHQLCKEAWFYSGLRKVETIYDGEKQEAFRPDGYFTFMQAYEFPPTFVLDISDTYNKKIESVKAHRSQFFDPNSNEPETILSRPSFFEFLNTRARYYGETIGVQYGEPFFSPVPIGVSDIFHVITLKK